MEQTEAAPDGQPELRGHGDRSGASPASRGKTCRIHLVGVIHGERYVHLGPYTLPAEGESVNLLEFATTMKRLITVSQGQDTWWRLEYTCYVNPVPILSDDALKEAFAYFREQHSTLSPEAAATACRLYLHPTASPPPWTLSDYLADTRIAPTLNPQGSQFSGDQAALNPEPSDARTGAPVVSAAAAAAGHRGASGDGASSSSSSHDAQHQNQATGHAAAAVAAGASAVPPVLLAAADNSSFSAEQQQPVWHSGDNPAQQQQQQQQLPAVDAAAAPRAAKRHAAGSPEQHNKVAQQQQQMLRQQQMLTQQDLAAPPAAEDEQQQRMSLLRQVGAQGSGGSDSRGPKATKRDSDSSPRSQWQQQQQPVATGLDGGELQQQQQQQQVGYYVSPFVAAAAERSAAGVAMPDLLPQLQQQQQYSGTPGLQATAGGMGPAGLSAGMLSQHLEGLQSQHQEGLQVSFSQPQPGSERELKTELQHEAGGEACSIASHLDQLQQLHLSNSSNNNNNNSSIGGGGMPQAPAGLRSAPSGVALESQQQQQQQQVWMLAAQQQQQQQQQQQLLLVNNNQLAVQMGPQASYSILVQGSSGDLAAAAAAAAAQAGSSRGSRAVAAAAGGGESSLQGLQLSLASSRVKAETKTKYADGRFKDEARHQQRLADMRGRCDALFGGAIAEHFRIEHHKRVTCLVCNGTVVPYEAYHIDAIRKHFVRHHEPWLAERGVDVDLWRKSCAPISKGLAISRGGGSSSSIAAARPAAAAAAGDDGGGAGDEAARKEDEGLGRKTSGTRHADGRYKDPQQHQQRLADMQSRCAALFNGTMTQHWSIVNHKSISCHLCSHNITPYAAYHPDCLRKHFVRRHEDVLVAAGVDVSAWSKGIPMGRRKLKALLQQQQQQQQRQLPQELLLQMQPMQQQQGLMPQAALLQISDADAAPQQQQPVMLLHAGSQPGTWAWLPIQEQQLQMQQQIHLQKQQQLQQQQQQQQHELVKRTSSSSSSAGLLLPPSGQQQQHQLASMPQVMPPPAEPSIAAAAAAAVPVTWPLQLPSDLSSLQMLTPLGPGQQHGPTPMPPPQQLFDLQQIGCTAAVPSASQAAQPQASVLMQQQQQPAAAVSPGQAFGSPTMPVSPGTQGLPPQAAPAAAAPAAVAVVQFAQPDDLQAPSYYNNSGAGSFSAAPGTAATPMQGMQQLMDGLAEAKINPVPASVSTNVHAQQQQQQQQHEPPQARSSSRSALAPALAAAAAAQQQQQQGSSVLQAALPPAVQQQPQKPEGTTADWARGVAEACGLSPMSLGTTPVTGLGFGPMSLSPAMGLQDLVMGGVGSLTEADVAAMWADDEEHDAALAEALLQQGPWSFEQ